MKVKNIIMKTVLIGAMLFNLTGSVSFASTKTTEPKVVNRYLSSVIKSNIIEYDNGSTLVINDRYKVYELFVEELEDWSIECDSKEELMEYFRTYNKHKNDYKKYDNSKIDVEEECCEYRLSNGITVIKTKDIATKDVYLPIFGDKLPYRANNLSDAEKIVITYLDSINYIENDSKI